MSDKLQEALERGLYGTPETKPDERRMFLSTIVERIYLALTKKQVIQKGMYDEAIDIMKSKRNIQLFINGSLSYQLYANYVKQANQFQVPFTVVNVEHETPIGLVLASKQEAINQTDIFIKDDLYKSEMGD
ncbi:YueI family protein [Desertibacillus haloalkaliphilus]|uniref:YueI family protein n=1 Tax=Desertibacillus haloalkaliphilus TaxID=1328930 RepID=UPI001C25F16C|nr:YueI family protein [Desertibacillus haloalkaliphilus]MBU8905732.1 YueI family protein [Desertibacillus haloalkaliphilus]